MRRAARAEPHLERGERVERVAQQRGVERVARRALVERGAEVGLDRVERGDRGLAREHAAVGDVVGAAAPAVDAHCRAPRRRVADQQRRAPEQRVVRAQRRLRVGGVVAGRVDGRLGRRLGGGRLRRGARDAAAAEPVGATDRAAAAHRRAVRLRRRKRGCPRDRAADKERGMYDEHAERRHGALSQRPVRAAPPENVPRNVRTKTACTDN